MIDKNFLVDTGEHQVTALRDTLGSMTGHRVRIMSLYQMLGPVGGMDYLVQQEANAANLQAALLGTGPAG